MVDSLSTSLQSYAAQVRERIDAALDSYTQLGEGCPPSLREAMRYSLLSGGKRLRPMLVLLAAEACGGSADAALPAAAAVEMVHTYSLVHDDLAGHGRRRFASRPADVSQSVRRGDGHPGGRRAVGLGLRSAGPRRAAAGPGRQVLCGAGPGGWGHRAGRRTGGRSGRRGRACRSRGAGVDPSPQDRGHVSGLRCELGARIGGGDSRRRRRLGVVMAENWDWRFRSPTIYSTWPVRPRHWANGQARIESKAS